MLTLYVLRHAKSSWNDKALDDYARPLNSRGRASAPVIGAYMEERGYAPQLILCSGARRTRETLGLMLPYLTGDITVRVEEQLYRTDTVAQILQRLRQIDDKRQSVMIVGHNPVSQELVLELTGNGDPEDLAKVEAKFPTGALAVLQFRATRWSSALPGAGTLTDIALPRELMDGE